MDATSARKISLGGEFLPPSGRIAEMVNSGVGVGGAGRALQSPEAGLQNGNNIAGVACVLFIMQSEGARPSGRAGQLSSVCL